VKAPLDIGLTDPGQALYLPVYTLRNLATRQTVQTTDPGRAMITGKWKDVGKFKGPILRALAARAPYFHNGSAATLEDVVEFYDTQFTIGFSAEEKADLVAFLRERCDICAKRMDLNCWSDRSGHVSYAFVRYGVGRSPLMGFEHALLLRIRRPRLKPPYVAAA
jgi:hypothetical protein